MITLTRLNGQPFVINAEKIRYVEQTPDTVVCCDTGEKMMVKEIASGSHPAGDRICPADPQTAHRITDLSWQRLVAEQPAACARKYAEERFADIEDIAGRGSRVIGLTRERHGRTMAEESEKESADAADKAPATRRAPTKPRTRRQAAVGRDC